MKARSGNARSRSPYFPAAEAIGLDRRGVAPQHGFRPAPFLQAEYQIHISRALRRIPKRMSRGKFWSLCSGIFGRVCEPKRLQNVLERDNAFEAAHVRAAYYRQNAMAARPHALQCQGDAMVGVNVRKLIRAADDVRQPVASSSPSDSALQLPFAHHSHEPVSVRDG